MLSPPKPTVARFFEVGRGLRSGKVHSQELRVKSKAHPLRVALAYSDFPGPALVNDLNLIVTAPDGSKTAGNQRRGAAAGLDSRKQRRGRARGQAGRRQVAGGRRGLERAGGTAAFALVALGHL